MSWINRWPEIMIAFALLMIYILFGYVEVIGVVIALSFLFAASDIFWIFLRWLSRKRLSYLSPVFHLRWITVFIVLYGIIYGSMLHFVSTVWPWIINVPEQLYALPLIFGVFVLLYSSRRIESLRRLRIWELLILVIVYELSTVLLYYAALELVNR